MTTLHCYNNALTSLDVTANTKLTTLYCYNNALTHLDVTANTKLTILSCGQQTPSVAIDQPTMSYTMPEGFDSTNVTSITGGAFNGSVLTVEAGADTVTYDYTVGSKTMSVTLTVTNPHTHAESGVCECGIIAINANNFPDETFRTYVAENFDTDGNGVLSAEEIAVVKSIYVSSKGITTLGGIEYFTNLTTLYCNNNSITSLDLSGFTSLQSLICNNNSLTSLDLSDCTALTTLYCGSNRLTHLDVTANTALTTLNCGSQTPSVAIDQVTMSYTLPTGFDSTNVTSITGGAFNGNVLTVDESADTVTYSYTVGSGTMSVTLTVENPHTHANTYTGVSGEGKHTMTCDCGFNETVECTFIADCATKCTVCGKDTRTISSSEHNFTKYTNLNLVGNTTYHNAYCAICEQIYLYKCTYEYDCADCKYCGGINSNKTVDHTYEDYLVSKDDTYHYIMHCTVCDKYITSYHSFDSETHTCACGAKTNGISQVSLTLGGDIGVNFYWVLADSVINDPEAYFLVKLPNGKTNTVLVSEMTADNSYYKVTGLVAAKEMAEDVTVELYVGGAVIASGNCSVRGYAERAFALAESDPTAVEAELITMIKAMLNYGAASQTLFGYNTGDLANSILEEDDKIVADVNSEQLDDVTVNANLTGIKNEDFSCILETKTTIRHYFSITEGTVDDYYFAVEGREVAPVQITRNGKTMYYVDITDIAAKDMDYVYTLMIVDKNDNASYVYASVYSYMNAVIKNKENTELVSTELVDTVNAMYAYGFAAYSYFG